MNKKQLEKSISYVQKNGDYLLKLKHDIEESRIKSDKKYLPEVKKMIQTNNTMILAYEDEIKKVEKKETKILT